MESVLAEEREIAYGIWNKDTGELMGSIGAFNFDENQQEISIELGFILFQKFAGKGYIPEAIKALEQILFSNGISTIIAKIDAENTRSRRAVEKVGFSWDGKEIRTKRSNPSVQLLVYRKMKKF